MIPTSPVSILNFLSHLPRNAGPESSKVTYMGLVSPDLFWRSSNLYKTVIHAGQVGLFHVKSTKAYGMNDKMRIQKVVKQDKRRAATHMEIIHFQVFQQAAVLFSNVLILKWWRGWGRYGTLERLGKCLSVPI